MDKNASKNKASATKEITTKETINDENILHDFKPSDKDSVFTKPFFIFLIAAVLLGVGTGYVLSPKSLGRESSNTSTTENTSSIQKGTIVGSQDSETFKDTVEGIMQKGGVDGEGQFHLVRSGGDSQNVYLTSSTVDLSKFISKKVKVWGQTQKAQVAGWLMDVGRVEVLE